MSCEVVDVDQVPAEFKREIVEVKVDKQGIIGQFKQHGAVAPGVQLHTDNEYVVIS